MIKIPQEEFARRRQDFMRQLGKNSMAIVPSAQEVTRSRDTEYPFRQDSDFYYLTGFNEPNAIAVFLPGREEGEFILFCRARDREREIWEGLRAGPEGACAQFGVDEAFVIGDVDDKLPALIHGLDALYYAFGQAAGFDQQVIGWVNNVRAQARKGVKAPQALLDAHQIIHEMRLIKSDVEIAVMAEAARISAEAHICAMKQCRPSVYEYQLASHIQHTCSMQGGVSPAYNSIVGGGQNACILHYVENNAELKSGDLVLIDAGCEFDHYAADITRTFPVNGTYSKAQRALYDLVLEAQRAALATIKPGVAWDEPGKAAVHVMTSGLVRLGLLKGDVQQLIVSSAYKDFYMHGIGHWLGMDVHDVGDYKIDGQWRALKAGMVMTVEPGIYVAPDNMSVDACWRGIGIRIEDDIVVTEKGYRILTDAVPKCADEIEALMASC